MSFPNLRVTDSGKAMMLAVLSGAPLVFTKIVLGNGAAPANYSALTAVQNPQAVGTIDSYERTGTVAKVHWSLNSESIANDFSWTEYGLYASSTLDENDDVVPGSDVLFSYAYDGTAPQPIASGDSATALQIEADINIAVGTAENVDAIVSEYSAYASKADFNAHVANTNNPHGVTASDVGLSNVENHSDTNAVPHFTESATLSNIVSGETAGTLWGKMKKLFTSHIAHLSASNPHSITTTKIGAANKTHYHSASDINSGILNVERGGTGGRTGTYEVEFSTSSVTCNAGRVKTLLSFSLPAGKWILDVEAIETQARITGSAEIQISGKSYNNVNPEVTQIEYYKCVPSYMTDKYFSVQGTFIMNLNTSETLYLNVYSEKAQSWYGTVHAIRII